MRRGRALAPDFFPVATLALAAALGLLTSPFWYAAAFGHPETRRTPELLAAPGSQCVLPAERIRGEHAALLSSWRDEAVRQGRRELAGASPGPSAPVQKVQKSLTRGCVQCHGGKQRFCDACHDYVGAAPNCWSCHDGGGTGR